MNRVEREPFRPATRLEQSLEGQAASRATLVASSEEGLDMSASRRFHPGSAPRETSCASVALAGFRHVYPLLRLAYRLGLPPPIQNLLGVITREEVGYVSLGKLLDVVGVVSYEENLSLAAGSDHDGQKCAKKYRAAGRRRTCDSLTRLCFS